METIRKTKKLDRAKARKFDEYYTKIEDIKEELQHYKKHFKDKVIYCNCDNPKTSNFFKYFFNNFKELGIKRLIANCFEEQNHDIFNRHKIKDACYADYRGKELEILPLLTSGDFRNYGCEKFFEDADILVTNPPFSLIRQYLQKIRKYNKKFIIIAPLTAISYIGIFCKLKSQEYKIGYISRKKNNIIFNTPGDKKIAAAIWLTNLDIDKKPKDIVLSKKYSKEKYPTYDNYRAIEVSRVKNIPIDYDGVMGVPITFMLHWNPNQFEILDIDNAHGGKNNELHIGGEANVIVKGKMLFSRIFIKKNKKNS